MARKLHKSQITDQQQIMSGTEVVCSQLLNSQPNYCGSGNCSQKNNNGHKDLLAVAVVYLFVSLPNC